MAEGDVAHIGRRCYVSNLAWRTSWQDLKDEFKSCGNVIYSNVIRDSNGRSKGWGIVEFETPEEALAAIQEKNGIELGGRNIIVREDREDRELKQYNEENNVAASRPVRGRGGRGRGRGRGGQGRGPPPEPTGESSGTQVVVHGLPWSYTDNELRPIFEGIGNIVHAEVAYGRDGRSRGYGTVQFGSAEEAQAAIQQLNGTELEGRTLSVKIDAYG